MFFAHQGGKKCVMKYSAFSAEKLCHVSEILKYIFLFSYLCHLQAFGPLKSCRNYFVDGVKHNICEFLTAYDLFFKAAHQHSDHIVHELFMHHKSSKKKHSACCQYMPDLIQDEREDNCITVSFIIKIGQGKFIQTTFL